MRQAISVSSTRHSAAFLMGARKSELLSLIAELASSTPPSATQMW
jgi:hypothetical protein